MTANFAFDQASASGKVGITVRGRPNAVEVVGQEDDLIDGEWQACLNIAASSKQFNHCAIVK